MTDLTTARREVERAIAAQMRALDTAIASPTEPNVRAYFDRAKDAQLAHDVIRLRAVEGLQRAMRERTSKGATR